MSTRAQLRLMRLYEFLHFGIHENAFTSTQNALILQLLEGRGLCPLHPRWGHNPRPPSPPSSTIFWIRQCTVMTHCVCVC